MWHPVQFFLDSIAALRLAVAKPTPQLGLRQSTRMLDETQLIQPKVLVDLLFDTGSGSLWVLDPSCAVDCPSSYNFTRPYFNPNASSTAQSENLRETITYLGGFVGLGFRPLAQGNTSIYDTLFHPTYLPAHRIGIYLGNAPETTSNPSPQTNGVVTFGGSEEDKYGAESLKWTDILPARSFQLYSHWIVPINGIKTTRHSATGRNKTTFPSQTGAVAIFDTGAAHISVPQSIIEEIFNTLGFNYTLISQGYRPPCSEVAKDNASLTLILGDVEITVTTNDLSNPGYTADEYCWPPFIPWDSSDWLVGKVFLKSFYSVWDLGGWNVSEVGDGNPRIGFSYLKEEYQPRLV
ncbi:aspartic peptidase domain-containing protein [Rhizoctonia solani]|nr:aspartic peptidase domain-containing protein [Rhizoctonia solani]